MWKKACVASGTSFQELLLLRGVWLFDAFPRLAHSQNLDEVWVAEQNGTLLQPLFLFTAFFMSFPTCFFWSLRDCC